MNSLKADLNSLVSPFRVSGGEWEQRLVETNFTSVKDHFYFKMNIFAGKNSSLASRRQE